MSSILALAFFSVFKKIDAFSMSTRKANYIVVEISATQALWLRRILLAL